VFKYAMKSKFMLLTALLALVVYSALDIVQPLIVKRVIDDELAGVQTVWVEVNQNDEDDLIASFNGRYFKKQSDDGSIIGEEYTIRYFDDNYYLITGRVNEKHAIKSVDDDSIEIEDNATSSKYTRTYVELTKE